MMISLIEVLFFPCPSPSSGGGWLASENTIGRTPIGYNRIDIEHLLAIESENLVPALRYGGSGGIAIIGGIIAPDTIVGWYIHDQCLGVVRPLDMRLVLPSDAPGSLGRYMPSCVGAADGRIALAVSNVVYVFRVFPTTALMHQVELPVVPTNVDVRGDTLYYVADQWNSEHREVGNAARRAFYGMAPLSEAVTSQEYWSVEEPKGLALNLFQPRTFMAVRGDRVAYVRGLGDALVVLSRGNVITSIDLSDICSGDMALAMSSLQTDTSWQERPHGALDRIREFYKKHDAIRHVEFASDSLIVVTVDHAEKYTSGIMRGRNVVSRHMYHLRGKVLSRGSVFVSTSPDMADEPRSNAPFSRNMIQRSDCVLAIEQMNVGFLDVSTFAELQNGNDQAATATRHVWSLQLRNKP